ncbi:unnamed protein product, partial [Cyprideis torosa]
MQRLENCTTIDQQKHCRKLDKHQYVFWNNTCTDQTTYCNTHRNTCEDMSEPGEGCVTSLMTYLNRTHCKNNSYSPKDPEKLKFIQFETAVSHTSPSEDFLNNSVTTCIVSGLTSFFCGFVTFGVAGFLANQVHKEVGSILKSGHELAYTVYPTATGLMPVPHLWAFIFFFMMLMIGANSI